MHLWNFNDNNRSSSSMNILLTCSRIKRSVWHYFNHALISRQSCADYYLLIEKEAHILTLFCCVCWCLFCSLDSNEHTVWGINPLKRHVHEFTFRSFLCYSLIVIYSTCLKHDCTHPVSCPLCSDISMHKYVYKLIFLLILVKSWLDEFRLFLF